MLTRKEAKEVAVGVGFLLPNILGFLAFTAIPLVISLFMAFTDWNLELHNYFRDEPLKFVGLDNFSKLFNEVDFYKYLGNTLFMMIGIPFGMAGSLISAILLNNDFGGGSRRYWGVALAAALMVGGVSLLMLAGMAGTAMTFLVCGLLSAIWAGGSAGGQTVYRTLFYFPHFTSGVATYILWKKLYSPDGGPINNVLQPILDVLAPFFAGLSPAAATAAGTAFIGVAGFVYCFMHWRNLKRWHDGEAGTLTLVLAYALLSAPLVLAADWTPFEWSSSWALWTLAGLGLAALLLLLAAGRPFKASADYGLSSVAILAGAVMCLLFALFGLSGMAVELPGWASDADGLLAPKWIADYYWAKPAIILMGLWSAFGSNNMLLYLAGLSGVPPELYEAADIDGASRWQRFWNVTWPQLAPITFFIFVMAVIGGLQGGFEMARTMTKGGPAGATTTLSYYIYTEGFDTGRLGYASAVAWTLFAMVLLVTLFNWKFGNRSTND